MKLKQKDTKYQFYSIDCCLKMSYLCRLFKERNIMRTTFFLVFYFCSLFFLAAKSNPKFVYKNEPLVLTENTISDGLGSFKAEDLPDLSPKCSIELSALATPMIKKMWKIALHDVELNLVKNDYGTYFAAGRRYTDRV